MGRRRHRRHAGGEHTAAGVPVHGVGPSDGRGEGRPRITQDHFNVAGTLDIRGYAYLGCILHLLVGTGAFTYLLSTPEGAHRLLLERMLYGVVPVSLGVALTATRLAGSKRASTFFYGWITLIFVMITALAAVDAGPRSLFAWALVLPVIFASISYPVVAVALNAAGSQAAVLFLMWFSHDWTGSDWYLFLYVAIFNVMAYASARNRHSHQAAEIDYSIQASHDPMTGCLSHGAFLSQLETECGRANRYLRGFTLLMADVDNFKGINDSRGHQAGDDALNAIGELLKERSRAGDAVGRLGGDEFGVLLLSTDAGHAVAWAERLRAARHQDAAVPGVTMSMGVASWSGPAETAGDVVRRADAALYRAKAQGRDRVVVS